MWKKIVAIVLLLALLGGGGFLIMKQRSVRQQEMARQQEIQRQMIPLQQEKRALLDQMQQLQRQYDGKMAQQATMQFVFTQLDERLYLEVFPAMLQNGIAGVMALSGEEYPGAPGRITSRQFDEMVRIAKNLSEGIPFVRVDLYRIGEQIFFSELTFYPGAGFSPYSPDEWERKIGDMLVLPDRRK